MDVGILESFLISMEKDYVYDYEFFLCLEPSYV